MSQAIYPASLRHQLLFSPAFGIPRPPNNSRFARLPLDDPLPVIQPKGQPMKLFTKSQYQQLLKNGTGSNRGKDHFPVVKLFTPDAQATWLLIDIDPEDPDMAFGLCDLGIGYPELGYVSLEELTSLRGKLGLPIERDRHFDAAHPLSVYIEAANLKEEITTNSEQLAQAAARLKDRRS